jgi:hypothetical protein
VTFHRGTAAIVLTGVWAVIALLVGDDAFGSSIWSTSFWDRYLTGVAMGAVLICGVVYLVADADDGATQKPIGVIDRPPPAFDLPPQDRLACNTPPVSEQRPAAGRRGVPLTVKIALVLTVLWAMLMFVLAYRDLGLGTYLFVVLPTGLLVFVTVDAIGRIAGWVAADPSRARKKTLGAIGRGLLGLWRLIIDGPRFR